MRHPGRDAGLPRWTTLHLAERLLLGVEGAVGLTHATRHDGSADLRPSAQLHLSVHWAL